MSAKRAVPFHPFLLALYPIVFLVSQNLSECSLADAVVPGAISVAGAGAIFLLLRALWKDADKSALVVSIGLLMFFSYGHLYTAYIAGKMIGSHQVGRHLYVLPAWSLTFLVLAWLVARSRRTFGGATAFLNAVSVILLAMSLGTIGLAQFTRKQAAVTSGWSSHVERELARTDLLKPDPGRPRPDIYYIILDEYSRADVLERYFAFDNGPFLEGLRRRGFYVADRSRSNYLTTYLSLGSSLNLDYQQELDRVSGMTSFSQDAYRPRLLHNLACKLLKKAGYRFVFFPSIYSGTSRNPNADVYMSDTKIDFSEFDRMLISTSMLTVMNAGYGAHRRRILYDFDQLAKIPEIEAPTYTFVHFTVPHAPFIFDADGNVPAGGVSHDDPLPKDVFIRGYAAQVAYLNKRLAETVDRILAKSTVPPVIILQGDHGPGFMMPPLTDPEDHLAVMRSPILNAYYLPGDGAKRLYPSISPVNSFRVIFNEYFGANLEMLDDATYSLERTGDGAGVPGRKPRKDDGRWEYVRVPEREVVPGP